MYYKLKNYIYNSIYIYYMHQIWNQKWYTDRVYDISQNDMGYSAFSNWDAPGFPHKQN